MSLLANQFDVRSILHGQVSLAAFNHMYVFHEVMNVCKNLNCFENVNIKLYQLLTTSGPVLTWIQCVSENRVDPDHLDSNTCTKMMEFKSKLKII